MRFANFTVFCKTAKFIHFNCLCQRYFCDGVRVRFAPSPTGQLHIGGARTALYNYLFAKSNKGKFILRIEDTNKNKNIEGADKELEDTLNWLQLCPDESPELGGAFGPYKQSQRIDIYNKYCNMLLEKRKAYKCFCTVDEIKQLPRTETSCSCANMSSEQIQLYEDENKEHCIRFKYDLENIEYEDIIHGQRKTNHSGRLDPVIMKADGFPTFFLASVIDDYLMKITHVIRGVEWMGQMHLILALYRAFEWSPPNFCHIPSALKTDRRKLSKRDFDLNIENLREKGYSSKTILSTTVTSGGGITKEKHIHLISMEDMVENFKLEEVRTDSTIVKEELLNSLSMEELRIELSNEERRKEAVGKLRELALAKYGNSLCVELTDNFLMSVLDFWKMRAVNVKDYLRFTYIWTHDFEIPKDIQEDEKLVKKVLELVQTSLKELEEFSVENIKLNLEKCRYQLNMKNKRFLKILRLHFCGIKDGPPMSEIFSILGKTAVFERFQLIKSRI